MSLNDLKKALRKTVEERRKSLSLHELAESDLKIHQNVIALPEYQSADVIFCFVSTEREINTTPVIEDAWQKGKRVGVPRCIEKGVMKVFEARSWDDLVAGLYGIREPRHGCPVIEPEQISLALIPCASCDDMGNRLGYGGGYYDRYLAGHTHFLRATLCRRALMCGQIPMEEFDIPIDLVITEDHIYRK